MTYTREEINKRLRERYQKHYEGTLSQEVLDRGMKWHEDFIHEQIVGVLKELDKKTKGYKCECQCSCKTCCTNPVQGLVASVYIDEFAKDLGYDITE